MSTGLPDSLGLPGDYQAIDPDIAPAGVDTGPLKPVDPVHPFDPAGPNPDYTSGYADGYASGYEDAIVRLESEPVDETALTFSQADLALLGAAFIGILVPLGILLSRTERPAWKLPWR